MHFHSLLNVATVLCAAVNALPVEQHVLQLQFEENNVDLTNNIVPMDEATYNSLPLIETEALQALINKDALEQRAKDLFKIAQRSEAKYGHPTRVIGSPGHWGTIGYVLDELRKLNGYYTFETQKFSVIDSGINSFSLSIDGVEPKSTVPFSYSPPTKDTKPVTGPLVLVKGYGCKLEDYPSSLINGSIALIERGECAFGLKSVNAGKSGALGAIIFDSDGPLRGTLGAPSGDEVATVAISKKEAQPYIDALSKNSTRQFEVTFFLDSYLKTYKTLNVIAETVHGDHDNVVFLGGHSDSVLAGPGINDDGSGTISVLEVAKQLTNYKVKNAVRFAWWAAEEEGLLGSDYYANHLTPEENSKLRLFMDYDMMASPNYEYEIYDANNEDHPAGSGDLKDLYVDWYTSHGLNYTFVELDGRSDYVAFLNNGIPSGGIATGAEGVKSKESAEKFGGKVGDWFDQCYHQLCDDLTNVEYEAWVINTKLIAHSVAKFAASFEGFPERAPIPASMTDISVSAIVETSTDDNKNFKYHGNSLIM